MSNVKNVIKHAFDQHRIAHEASCAEANHNAGMNGYSTVYTTGGCMACHGPLEASILASVSEAQPTVQTETPVRLIGPIPASYAFPVFEGVYAHPGGPAPRWGGYSPVLVGVPLSWLSAEVQALVTQPGTCWGSEGRSLRGAIYRSHTTDTLLVLAADGWYVAAPSRPCRRAVTIAVDALRDGAVVCGLLAEEAAEAVRIHRDGGATNRARLPWEADPATSTIVMGEAGDVEIFRRTLNGDE